MVARRLGETLPLQVFIRRAQVVKSYRDIMRAARKCEDQSLRNDILSEIRSEYARNKHVSDVGMIKQHLQVASKELKKVRDLCDSIRLSNAPAAQSSAAESYPTNVRIDKHMRHPGPSWIDTKDEEDPRGRVGEGWPWDR